MFTGIIQALGTVCSVSGGKEGARLEIDTKVMDLADVAIGDSIAVNGVCLTVVALGRSRFSADVSKETLACVCEFNVDTEVNLEKAMRLSDRLGGHLMAGHVDGVGKILATDALADSRVVSVQVPPALTRYLARKGSIAMNGVSLTINDVGADFFLVNLIRHTLATTNLQGLAPASRVNLEVDMIARYVERMTMSERA